MRENQHYLQCISNLKKYTSIKTIYKYTKYANNDTLNQCCYCCSFMIFIIVIIIIINIIVIVIALAVNVSCLHVVPTGCFWNIRDDKWTDLWRLCVGNDQSMVEHEGKRSIAANIAIYIVVTTLPSDQPRLRLCKTWLLSSFSTSKTGSPMFKSVAFEKLKLYVQSV